MVSMRDRKIVEALQTCQVSMFAEPKSTPPPLRRSGRLRLTGLVGVLLGSAVAYLCHFPLPDFFTEAEPTYLEQFWFKLTKTEPARGPDVIFVPTPQAAVNRMLELAELKPDDVLYDLGCGDGRFVVTAAKKYGVRAVGVDIDPMRIAQSQRNVKTNGVSHLVTILKADIFQMDFSDATVVTLYLLPELNVRLMPKLAQLKPGTRILSFDFDMRGAKPRAIVEARTEETQRVHRIYQWTVPWEPE